MYVIKVKDPNEGPNKGQWIVLRHAKSQADVRRKTENYRRNKTKFRVELLRNQPS